MQQLTRRLIKVFLATAGACLLAGGVLMALGWRAYIIHTGSMSPHIPSGDLVIDRPAAAVAVGNVITFSKAPGQYTTHRIAAITSYGIKTRGDANPSDDFGYVHRSEIAGRVTAVIPYAGFVVKFFSYPTGVAGLMLLMCSVWLAWTLFMADRGEGLETAPALRRT